MANESSLASGKCTRQEITIFAWLARPETRIGRSRDLFHSPARTYTHTHTHTYIYIYIHTFFFRFPRHRRHHRGEILNKPQRALAARTHASPAASERQGKKGVTRARGRWLARCAALSRMQIFELLCSARVTTSGQ